MIITKKKGKKFSQDHYDLFFRKIEYNLRELGFGDVSVNAKMKEFNKIRKQKIYNLWKETLTNSFIC